MTNGKVTKLKATAPAMRDELVEVFGDQTKALLEMVRWSKRRAKEIEATDLGKKPGRDRPSIEVVGVSGDRQLRVEAELDGLAEGAGEPVLKIDAGNWTGRSWDYRINWDHQYASQSHVIVYGVFDRDGGLAFEFQLSPHPPGVSSVGQDEEFQRRLVAAGVRQRRG